MLDHVPAYECTCAAREFESAAGMEDLLEVLFEYRGSKRAILVECSNLCEDVGNELQARHGISRPTVTLSATAPAASRSSQSWGNVSEKFFLQKWCTKWKEYVDVERASDVKEGDKLTVVKICSDPPGIADDADTPPVSAKVITCICNPWIYFYTHVFVG